MNKMRNKDNHQKENMKMVKMNMMRSKKEMMNKSMKMVKKLILTWKPSVISAQQIPVSKNKMYVLLMSMVTPVMMH